jgi:hypothetical protein
MTHARAETLRRARRVAAELSRPADCWLGARILLWAAVVRVAKYAVPLPTLVRVISPVPHHGRRSAERERRIALFAEWASRVVRPRSPGNCLERSLVSYRFLIRADADPELMIGFRRDDTGMLGHAWVLVDGRPLGDSPTVVATYEVAMAFGRGHSPMADPAH